MNIVKLPKLYFIVGTVCGIFFLCILVVFLITSDEITIVPLVIFSAFAFLGLFEVIICLNWRVKYDEESFEYRTILRRSLKLKYSDIALSRTTKSGATWLIVGKRRLLIDPYAIGRSEFLERVIWNEQERKAVLSKRRQKKL